MKTGAYWFKFLTEKEQDEFKENLNTISGVKDFMELDFNSFEHFIRYCFQWNKTRQGLDYWVEISKRKVE